MPLAIKLESGVKGYRIIRKNCKNCGADFVFRLENNKVYDVIGDAFSYPEEKIVRCKICLSTFKYEFSSTRHHVGSA